MITLSATCLAIALADQAGTLRLTQMTNPRLAKMGLNADFVAISDATGLIEVAADMAEAKARVATLRERASA